MQFRCFESPPGDQEACELPFRFRLFRTELTRNITNRNRWNFARHAAVQSGLDLFRLVNQAAIQDRDTGWAVAERFLGRERCGDRQSVLLQLIRLRERQRRPARVRAVPTGLQRLRRDRA